MSIEKYRNNFLKEVEERVEEGNWVKMCMQCGVCAGSCPLGSAWAHPPQEIFMMIRAGKREEVLTSDSMWMCTSCYNCVARCPRKLPITHIMHGLAYLAKREGLAPKNNPTVYFGQKFWDNLVKTGRVNEAKLAQSLYFKDGFSAGIKRSMEMKDVALGLVKAGRLNVMEMLGGHSIKDKSGFHAMLKKARELEDKRRKLA
jgi:quinone-modifying oxidoreductase subunit QmoC